MQGPEGQQPWQPGQQPIPPPSGYTPNQQPVNGTLILVLGILSIICCNILGPVTWIMGNNALRTLDTGQDDPSQRQLVVIGRILGMVGTALLVLGVLWVLFLGGLGFLGALSGGGAAPPPGSPFPQ